MTSLPEAIPACRAIHPAFRPMTSHTITRWWLIAVEWSRSRASVAVATAVRKPKVTSVPSTSLSIVLGTPIQLMPASTRGAVQVIVPSPPMTISASSLFASMWRRHRSVTSVNTGLPWASVPVQKRLGLHRLLVPRMVPPCVMMPATCRLVSSPILFSTRPRKPSSIPMTRTPCL